MCGLSFCCSFLVHFLVSGEGGRLGGRLFFPFRQMEETSLIEGKTACASCRAVDSRRGVGGKALSWGVSVARSLFLLGLEDGPVRGHRYGGSDLGDSVRTGWLGFGKGYRQVGYMLGGAVGTVVGGCLLSSLIYVLFCATRTRPSDGLPRCGVVGSLSSVVGGVTGGSVRSSVLSLAKR